MPQFCHLCSPNGIKHRGRLPLAKVERNRTAGHRYHRVGRQETRKGSLCNLYSFSLLQFSPAVALSLTLGLDLDLKEKRLMRRREKLPAFFPAAELVATLDKSS